MRSPHQMAYIQTLLNIASRQGFFNHERGAAGERIIGHLVPWCAISHNHKRGAVAKRERRIRASPSNKPAGDPNTESPIIEQRAGDLMALPEQAASRENAANVGFGAWYHQS